MRSRKLKRKNVVGFAGRPEPLLTCWLRVQQNETQTIVLGEEVAFTRQEGALSCPGTRLGHLTSHFSTCENGYLEGNGVACFLTGSLESCYSYLSFLDP